MTDALTDHLWGSIRGTYQAILEHPFIQGLTSGSLSGDAFRFYVVQDALYLTEYAKALAVCAARSPHEESVKMFSEHAAGAIAVERQLHESFFKDFGLTEAQVRATPMAPTNLAYTSYLLASTHQGSFPEAIGAVLPCYWIYWEVGKELMAAGSQNPQYQQWVETYGGEDFADVVRAVLALTDQIGADLPEAEVARVTRRFQTTARYEWMFWDMGYRMESWPV